ncbi:MAG: lysophospholipid acyltransferase family protein [Rikenellaceae bacterium]|jgi:putative hemolysin|nr:lysophospholipid acyltransferase family protein [Rikenellaceae bacterium]
MQLIDKKELAFGRKGPLVRVATGFLMSVLGLNRINRLYARAAQGDGPPGARILHHLGAAWTAGEHDLKNIPATGPAIVVANHPTGLLDGIVLIDMLSRVRPDVRFMGNFLLDRIDYLKPYFIAVDPFDGADRTKNMRGIRACRKHLAADGMLVIFPAGEVATWQKGFSQLRDKAWSPSVLRFIRNAAVPVVPVCIEARNSNLFHLAGKITPLLRTALLPHELNNKRGKMVTVNIGAPLTPKRTAALADATVWNDYLRANVDYLTHKRRRKLRIIPARKPAATIAEEITSGRERELLIAELKAIRPAHLLFEYGTYDVFFAPSARIPNMMHEIGRMREVTFRQIGEGSMKSIDTDPYDEYYHQLFIWDRTGGALVGAYRMGMGREIIPRFGLEGFYTHSLFHYSPEMAPILEKTIELGRSFITAEYQRKAVSLMLLWKGIVYVLLKHDDYRNLLGPVTISGDFQASSKIIISTHLQQHHFDPELAAWVHPVTGMKGINAAIDPALIRGVEDIDLINKIVTDIERDEFSIPILIRKYLQLNSHVLGFNVDHDFSDALDALMLLDLKRVPENTILMLSKEITDIDVLARFRSYHPGV